MKLRGGPNNIEPALVILVTACAGYYVGAAVYANLLLRTAFVGAEGSFGIWEWLFLIFSLMAGAVLAVLAILTGVGVAGGVASLMVAAHPGSRDGLAPGSEQSAAHSNRGRRLAQGWVLPPFNLVATYMVTGKLGKAASVSILGFLPGVVAGLAMGAMTQPQTKLN
jgi:hypothetical protein